MGQRLCGARASVAGESKGEDRDEEQNERDDCGKDGERGGHGSVVFYRKPRWGVGREPDRKIGG